MNDFDRKFERMLDEFSEIRKEVLKQNEKFEKIQLYCNERFEKQNEKFEKNELKLGKLEEATAFWNRLLVLIIPLTALATPFLIKILFN